ncbi:hypothetical protein LCGC14_0849470 [marine sediment metagenome]|uniref:Uncharacterized protein n=1 Tax=marine sediment metagenome TaxID=412755 RepID=A0A0F9PFI1_9ZZZZ
MSFSNTYENVVLDHLFRKGTLLTPMATISVGLCTASPGEGGTSANCNEVANSNNYRRVVTTATVWNTAVAGQISNLQEIVFLGATGNWGTVTHVALFTSNTYGLGSLIAFGALAVSQYITISYTTLFESGALIFTLN